MINRRGVRFLIYLLILTRLDTFGTIIAGLDIEGFKACYDNRLNY